MNSDFHPLTIAIKKYFADNADNDFMRRIIKVADVERMEVFPDEPDDEEVIIIFETTNDRDLACIVFANGRAWIEFERWKYFFVIPFYYPCQTDMQKYLWKGSRYFGAHSVYDNYEMKGLEKLLDDVATLIENVVAKKLDIEYMGKLEQGKWRVVLHPNSTISHTPKWKEKFISNKKLKTERIVY